MIKKINQKAFTLVELLAIFVILGIIATIAYYSIDRIKDASAKEIFETSVKDALTAAQQYYAENDYSNYPEAGYRVTRLPIQNKEIYKSGIIKLVDSKFVAQNVGTEDYCANGPIDDLVIIEGACTENVYVVSDTSDFDIVPGANMARIYIEEAENRYAYYSAVVFLDENNIILSIWVAYSAEEENYDLLMMVIEDSCDYNPCTDESGKTILTNSGIYHALLIEAMGEWTDYIGNNVSYFERDNESHYTFVEDIKF